MSEERKERFCALYEGTRPRIIAYAMRRTRSPEDAADIVAETFVIAWRKLDDIPPGHDGLLWLYVTARHVLANHGRRLRRRDELTRWLADELRGAELREQAQDEDSILALFCLNSLPAGERELLMLAGWEGLSVVEISRVLGCSPTAARIRLHRARARLKAEIAEFATRERRPDPIKQAPDGGVPIRYTPREAGEL